MSKSMKGDRGVSSKREVWVDYIKVFACILVVLGHLFQSIVKAGIMPETALHQWFNTTIYYFHVPLFFLCSGYLYQKYSHVTSIGAWRNNVIKKAITLGIPYIVFTFATWLLKTVFSGSVNNQIGSLGDTLLLHPTSPYWYLYILFLMFFITPTMTSLRNMLIISIIAIAGKVVQIIGGGCYLLQIYALSSLLSNLIWFVYGMVIAFGKLKKYTSRLLGTILGVVFLGISICSYKSDNLWVSFAMGFIACSAVFMVVADCKRVWLLSWFANYTMPIFLMHTMFAAMCRILLMKIGLINASIQIVIGIAASFIGPISAMIILEKVKLDFLVYPGKLIEKES